MCTNFAQNLTKVFRTIFLRVEILEVTLNTCFRLETSFG